MVVGMPRARANARSKTPATVRLTARKVHTDTSRTAIVKSAQFVPQTKVRTRTRGSALAAAVRDMGADHAVFPGRGQRVPSSTQTANSSVSSAQAGSDPSFAQTAKISVIPAQ